MNSRDLFFILNKSGSDRVLLLRTDKGLKLPAYDEHVPENVGFSDPGPFNVWFTNRYGIEVVRRYAIDLQGVEEAFFVLETCHEFPAVPCNALWISPEELRRLAVTPSNHRGILESWCMDSYESAAMPFSRSRGFEIPLAWMHAALEKQGTPAVDRPQQVKNAYVSTVFQCATTIGDVYLKILPPVFIREAQITTKLAEWGIVRLPEMLAVDSERGLILTKDMGGCDLTDCFTVDKLEVIVRTFAEFQLEAMELVDPRAPWPFYDWRICVLIKEMDALFDEAPALLDDSPYALNAGEISQLERKLPQWKKLLTEIQGVPLPGTIAHGDLRPGNIRVVSDGFILYDWAWSSITHPFIGITTFLHIVRRSLCNSRSDREFLRDAYLDAWAGYASGRELRRIFDLVTKALAFICTAENAEWLRSIGNALRGNVPKATSADAWTLRWRQFYYAKVVRRLLAE